MNKLIVYPPARNVNNSYIQNLVDSLRLFLNSVANDYDFKKVIFNLFSFKDCVLILNWYENKSKNVFYFLISIFAIKILKFRKNKIYFVFHNLKSHDNNKYKNKMILFLLRISDKTIIHNIESEKKIENVSDILYFPHPLYNITNISSNNKSKILNLCIFGKIEKYKQVSEFLKYFNSIDHSGVKVSIIGNVKSEKLKNEIIAEINDDVSVEFGFFPEDKLGELGKYDYFLITNSEDSCLNSGVLSLAFSLGRPVIVPNYEVFKIYDNKSYISKYDVFYGLEDVFQKLKSESVSQYTIKCNECIIDNMSSQWKDFAKKIVETL